MIIAIMILYMYHVTYCKPIYCLALSIKPQAPYQGFLTIIISKVLNESYEILIRCAAFHKLDAPSDVTE